VRLNYGRKREKNRQKLMKQRILPCPSFSRRFSMSTLWN